MKAFGDQAKSKVGLYSWTMEILSGKIEVICYIYLYIAIN